MVTRKIVGFRLRNYYGHSYKIYLFQINIIFSYLSREMNEIKYLQKNVKNNEYYKYIVLNLKLYNSNFSFRALSTSINTP